MLGTAGKTGWLIAQVRDCCAHQHQTSVGPHSAFKALSHSNLQQRTYPGERPPIFQDLPSLKKIKILSYLHTNESPTKDYTSLENTSVQFLGRWQSHGVKSCCSWSLLYNTTLRSQADSLHSHAILHEWLTFYSVFLNIQLKWCTYSTDMAGASWNCCCLGAFHVHHTTCHFMQSHICKVHLCLAVTCQLHFWQNDWGSFMCYCCKMRGGMDAEIRVSTEVNPGEENSPAAPAGARTHDRPFNHESGTLTIELPRSPFELTVDWDCWDLQANPPACARPSSPHRVRWHWRCAGQSISCPAGSCLHSHCQRTWSCAHEGSEWWAPSLGCRASGSSQGLDSRKVRAC